MFFAENCFYTGTCIIYFKGFQVETSYCIGITYCDGKH